MRGRWGGGGAEIHKRKFIMTWGWGFRDTSLANMANSCTKFKSVELTRESEGSEVVDV